MQSLLWSAAHHFEAAGYGGPWLLVIWALSLALVLHRAHVLWSAGRGTDVAEDVAGVLRTTRSIEDALGHCATVRGAAARVLTAGLLEAARPPAHVRQALRSAREAEVARVRRGAGALRLMSQVGFLAGLFFTITGLVLPMCGPPLDATSRATCLAKAMSEAMHCTVFGLGISIVALTACWIFTRRIAVLEDVLAAESARLEMTVVALHPFLRLAGRPAAHTLVTYR